MNLNRQPLSWRMKRLRARARGFSLLEMAMVLVIIGVVMGAVMVGTDVLRHAKGQKAFSVFVAGWRDAFAQFAQVTGRLPGDDPTDPKNAVLGAAGQWLCGEALSDAFLAARIRIPQGRGIRFESQYTYEDSNGSPHQLTVCFATVDWSVQVTSVGTFERIPRHVMRLTDLTTELALQMDVLVDGSVSGRFGQFRREPFHIATTEDQVDWGVTGPQNGAVNQVTALFEMF